MQLDYKDDCAWQIDDPMIEWTGRAEGMDDQQFAFSDIIKSDDQKQKGMRSMHLRMRK